MLKRKTDERKRKTSIGPERKLRESPVEQLRERNRVVRKETDREPSTRTGKQGMRNQARDNGEDVGNESRKRALRQPL